jgi:hypothetical protein
MEVDDSTAEDTDADESEAAPFASSTASTREAAKAIKIAEAMPWKRMANVNFLTNSGNCCQVVEKKTR